MLGPVCDLEIDVGFEGTIQDPELDSRSSSMFGGRGMFGTFLLRNRLTTVMGNIVLIKRLKWLRMKGGKKLEYRGRKKKTMKRAQSRKNKKNVLHWHGDLGPIGPRY